MKKAAVSALLLATILDLTAPTAANAALLEPPSTLAVTNIGQSANLTGDTYANLAEWFVGEISYAPAAAPHADYFAPYDFQAVGEDLYVGIGVTLPAEYTGAVVGKYNADLELSYVFSPTEDSFHDMDFYEGKIYIPGTDPGVTDGQDAGNEYVLDTSNDTVLKLRYNPNSDPADEPYLPDVIHSWGHWVDPETGFLYVTTGSAGDNATIFKSATAVDDPDFGQESFEVLNNLRNYHTTAYRTMDIIGFDGHLFASTRSGGVPSESTMRLYSSADDGANWTQVAGVFPEVYSQFLIHDNKLVIVGVDYSKFYVFSESDQFETYEFSDFDITNIPLPSWNPRGFASPHPMVSVGEYLYAAGEDHMIYRTKNFEDWEKVAELSDDIATIEYWPARDQLVVGTFGSNASIYLVDLNSLTGISGSLFSDYNDNHVLDTGEIALEGLDVELFDSETGFEIADTVTNDDGEFELSRLMGNSYRMTVTGNINGEDISQEYELDLELGEPLVAEMGVVLAAVDNPDDNEEPQTGNEEDSLAETGLPIIEVISTTGIVLAYISTRKRGKS